jgi:hypothetical protein
MVPAVLRPTVEFALAFTRMVEPAAVTITCFTTPAMGVSEKVNVFVAAVLRNTVSPEAEIPPVLPEESTSVATSF